MQGKPKAIDIAYLAGVSQPTVSRALRGSPMVSEETRRRIETIAQQLNYKVDKNASNLRRQHSDTLALLLFEDPTPDDSLINPFFLPMLGSITRACAQHGYDLLVSFQQLSDDWHVDYEDSRKADGLILLGYGDYLAYRRKLRTARRPGHALRALGRGAAGPAGHFDRLRQFPRRRPAARISRSSAAGSRVSRRCLQPLSRIPRPLPRLCAKRCAKQGLAIDPRCRSMRSSAEESGYAAARKLLRRGAALRRRRSPPAT